MASAVNGLWELGNYSNSWTCSLCMEWMKESPLKQCIRNETLVQSLMLTVQTKYENKLNFHFCFSQQILKVNSISNVVSLLLVLLIQHYRIWPSMRHLAYAKYCFVTYMICVKEVHKIKLWLAHPKHWWKQYHDRILSSFSNHCL